MEKPTFTINSVSEIDYLQTPPPLLFNDFATAFDQNRIRFVVVKEMNRDLFEMPEDYALGHCVAADMRMGRGIAIHFRQKFRNIDELLAQNQAPGGLAVLFAGGRYIYYLVTKKYSNGKPTTQTLFDSLLKLRDHMVCYNVRKIALPKIGCGLDCLKWGDVKPMLEYVFKDSNIEIVVCSPSSASVLELESGGSAESGAQTLPWETSTLSSPPPSKRIKTSDDPFFGAPLEIDEEGWKQIEKIEKNYEQALENKESWILKYNSVYPLTASLSKLIEIGVYPFDGFKIKVYIKSDVSLKPLLNLNAEEITELMANIPDMVDNLDAAQIEASLYSNGMVDVFKSKFGVRIEKNGAFASISKDTLNNLFRLGPMIKIKITDLTTLRPEFEEIEKHYVEVINRVSDVFNCVDTPSADSVLRAAVYNEDCPDIIDLMYSYKNATHSRVITRLEWVRNNKYNKL